MLSNANLFESNGEVTFTQRSYCLLTGFPPICFLPKLQHWTGTLEECPTEARKLFRRSIHQGHLFHEMFIQNISFNST